MENIIDIISIFLGNKKIKKEINDLEKEKKILKNEINNINNEIEFIKNKQISKI